jgi:single-strand DNA-binding protein
MEHIMGSMNRVYLMGNLTHDPESRKVGEDSTVTNFGLAINEAYKNKNGEEVETTCFVDIVVWGAQALACEAYLKKGAPVLVEGRLQFERWEADGGVSRTRLRVKADRVQFLGTRKAEPVEAG